MRFVILFFILIFSFDSYGQSISWSSLQPEEKIKLLHKYRDTITHSSNDTLKTNILFNLARLYLERETDDSICLRMELIFLGTYLSSLSLYYHDFEEQLSIYLSTFQVENLSDKDRLKALKFFIILSCKFKKIDQVYHRKAISILSAFPYLKGELSPKYSELSCDSLLIVTCNLHNLTGEDMLKCFYIMNINCSESSKEILKFRECIWVYNRRK